MTEPATASQVVPPWQGPKRQAEILPVTQTMVTEYATWFVNTRAFC